MRHPNPTALALSLLAILLNNSASAQFPIALDRLLPIDSKAQDVVAFDDFNAHVILNQSVTEPTTGYTFALDFNAPRPSNFKSSFAVNWRTHIGEFQRQFGERSTWTWWDKLFNGATDPLGLTRYEYYWVELDREANLLRNQSLVLAGTNKVIQIGEKHYLVQQGAIGEVSGPSFPLNLCATIVSCQILDFVGGATYGYALRSGIDASNANQISVVQYTTNGEIRRVTDLLSGTNARGTLAVNDGFLQLTMGVLQGQAVRTVLVSLPDSEDFVVQASANFASDGSRRLYPIRHRDWLEYGSSDYALYTAASASNPELPLAPLERYRNALSINESFFAVDGSVDGSMVLHTQTTSIDGAIQRRHRWHRPLGQMIANTEAWHAVDFASNGNLLVAAHAVVDDQLRTILAWGSPDGTQIGSTQILDPVPASAVFSKSLLNVDAELVSFQIFPNQNALGRVMEMHKLDRAGNSQCLAQFPWNMRLAGDLSQLSGRAYAFASRHRGAQAELQRVDMRTGQLGPVVEVVGETRPESLRVLPLGDLALVQTLQATGSSTAYQLRVFDGQTLSSLSLPADFRGVVNGSEKVLRGHPAYTAVFFAEFGGAAQPMLRAYGFTHAFPLGGLIEISLQAGAINEQFLDDGATVVYYDGLDTLRDAFNVVLATGEFEGIFRESDGRGGYWAIPDNGTGEIIHTRVKPFRQTRLMPSDANSLALLRNRLEVSSDGDLVLVDAAQGNVHRFRQFENGISQRVLPIRLASMLGPNTVVRDQRWLVPTGTLSSRVTRNIVLYQLPAMPMSEDGFFQSGFE